MKAEYIPFVEELIELAIKEDIGDGDHTSLCCIPAEERGRMRLLCKQEGIYKLRRDYLNGLVDENTVFTVDISFLNLLGSANYPTSYESDDNIASYDGMEIFRWWVDESTGKICLRFYENVYTGEGDVSNTKVAFEGTLDASGHDADGQLHFGVDGETITVPSWRADVVHYSDLAEEVARFYGYDNIPTTMFAGDACAVIRTPEQNLKELLSDAAISLGFDEVLFTDFCFPPTTNILYEGDKVAALNEAAQHLVYNLATEDFCVSFLCNDPGFKLPEGRTRIYRDGVDASMAQEVAASLDIPSMQINLVYLTEAMDTRFDVFGVLRPLNTGLTALPAVTTPAESPEEPAEPAEEPAAQPQEEPAEQPGAEQQEEDDVQ